MGKELLESLVSLKEALSSDPRVKRLDELEKSVSVDPIVKELSKRMNALEKSYEDVLAYKKASDLEAIQAQKALYEAKTKLDSYPLVEEYDSAYVLVRDLYMAVDDALFSAFRKRSLDWEST
jgi:cell fate (sporulation/competence/biofilm development) regulator YmcA (YheA/YmcA/DUF963 family)